VGKAELVGSVVEDLLKRKFHIASGGAVGADEYCVGYLVHVGECDKGTLYSPWSTYESFPVKVRSGGAQQLLISSLERLIFRIAIIFPLSG